MMSDSSFEGGSERHRAIIDLLDISMVYLVRFGREYLPSIKYFVLIGGAFFSFFPMILDINDRGVLNSAPSELPIIETLQLYWSSIANLAVLSPLAIEWLIECTLSVLNASRRRNTDAEFLCSSEMLIIIIGLLIFPLVELVTLSAGTNSVLSTCCEASRSILVVGALGSSFSRVDAELWPGPLMTLALVFFVISEVIKVAQVATTAPSATVTQLSSARVATLCVAVALFSIMCVRWLYFTLHQLVTASPISRRSAAVMPTSGSGKGSVKLIFRSSTKTLSGGNVSSSMAVHYHTVFVGLVIVCIAIILLAHLCIGYTSGSKAASLTQLVNTTYIVVQLLLLILTIRKTKLEAAEGLVSNTKLLL
jgi:hypothetical protein